MKKNLKLRKGAEGERRGQSYMVQKVVLLGILGIAAWQDWRKKKVSAYLLVGSGFAGLLCYGCFRQITAAEMLLGAAVGVVVLFMGLITGEKIGYGDGAMVFVCGIFLGFAANLELLCIALFLVELAALFLIAVKRKGRRYQIPFIPFLLAGYLFLLI